MGKKLNMSKFDDFRAFLGSNFPDKASKSAQDASLGPSNTLDSISVWEALGMVKSTFIFAANIIVVILETVLWVLKSILGLIT